MCLAVQFLGMPLKPLHNLCQKLKLMFYHEVGIEYHVNYVYLTHWMISIADSWNCVATVFFIDTAHNVIDYIEAIYKILQPGGCWINLGIVAHTFKVLVLLRHNCTSSPYILYIIVNLTISKNNPHHVTDFTGGDISLIKS